MLWLILIGSAVALIGTGLLIDKQTTLDMEPMVGIGAFGIFILLVFLFIGTFFSSYNHVDDLESVEYHSERIDIQEVRLDRLRSTLEDFEYPEGALLNKDSPVASIVEQISETEKAISQAKEAKAETEKDIRARKLWLFGYVTTIVGE